MSATIDFFFFFQAEDGIRDAQESRGLGDVYKRQGLSAQDSLEPLQDKQVRADENLIPCDDRGQAHGLSLIHI